MFYMVWSSSLHMIVNQLCEWNRTPWGFVTFPNSPTLTMVLSAVAVVVLKPSKLGFQRFLGTHRWLPSLDCQFIQAGQADIIGPGVLHIKPNLLTMSRYRVRLLYKHIYPLSLSPRRPMLPSFDPSSLVQEQSNYYCYRQGSSGLQRNKYRF